MPERPNGATYKHRRRAQSGPLEPAPQRCVPAQGRGELPVRAGTGPQASATRQCPPAEVAGESPTAQGPACAESSASSRPRSGRAARPLAEGSPSALQPELRPLRATAAPRSHAVPATVPPLGSEPPAPPGSATRATPLTISLTAAGLPASLRTRLAVGRPRRCLRLRVRRGDACSVALRVSVRKHLLCRVVMLSSRAFPARSCCFLYGICLGFPS